MSSLIPFVVGENYTNFLDSYFKPSFLKTKKTPSGHIVAHLVYHRLDRVVALCLRECVNPSSPTFPIKIEDFNKKNTPYKITPLQLAIIRGSYELASQMIQSGGIDLDGTDIHGWTALHHAAAMTDQAVITKLLEYKANPKMLNDRNGTYLDLWNLTHAPARQAIEYQIPLWDESQKKMDIIDGAAFEKLTGARFSDEVLTSSRLLIKDWLKMDHEPESANAFLQETVRNYEEFSKNPPSIYMSKTHFTDEGKPMKDIGYGVFAGQDIQPKQVICEYIGKEISNEEENSEVEYLFSGIDGKSIRGFGSMIQDGFPNCAFIPINNLKGRKQRLILIALEPVAKGQPLFIDYMSHYVKWTDHVEPRPLALRQFVQGRPLKPMFDDLMQIMRNIKTSCIYDNPNLADAMKLTYLFSTPSSLLYLYFSNALSLKDLELFFNPLYSSEMTCKVKNAVQDGLVYLESLPEKYQQPVKCWFAQKFASGKMQVIFNIIYSLKRYVVPEKIEHYQRAQRKELDFTELLNHAYKDMADSMRTESGYAQYA